MEEIPQPHPLKQLYIFSPVRMLCVNTSHQGDGLLLGNWRELLFGTFHRQSFCRHHNVL